MEFGSHGGNSYGNVRARREFIHNSSLPSYIKTLIDFNKQRIKNCSHEDLVKIFLDIAQKAEPSNFRGQSLSMLFVSAKKYKIKFCDWQNRADILWIFYMPIVQS